MMRSRSRRPLSLLAVAVTGFLFLAASAPPSKPIAVMSFNIRYGTAEDGKNHWTRRRALLFDVLRQQNADLIGLQEALDSQIREIIAAIPGYAVIGVGRDDGKAAGEYTAILIRKDRFNVAEAGTFWLSDTPAVPGSKSWGNNITRICTWARLIEPDRFAFWIFNVHLDHESQPSRERSAELLAKRVDARSFREEPVIVIGDFNADEDNAAIKRLVPKMFVDSFRVVQPEAREVGTFNGFEFGRTRGPKVDYVLVPPGTDVLSADIIRTSRAGRYPSDHFPVVARVRPVTPAK